MKYSCDGYKTLSKKKILTRGSLLFHVLLTLFQINTLKFNSSLSVTFAFFSQRLN